MDYSDEERVYRALATLLGCLGGITKFVKPEERVLIKPNLLAGDSPDRAVTTHPSVVAGIVRMVKEAGGIPIIGDSPSVAKLESVAVPTGMTDVAARWGAALIDLSTPANVSVPEGIILRRVTVAREALDADAIISLSKLKTHGFTTFTGAVKNMFGVVPGLLKADYHLQMPEIESFSATLLDVYAAIPARLHVMDGIWAMEGPKGPRSGKPKHLGVLLASADGIALDAVATSIIGIDPQTVPTTRIGHLQAKGVGSLDRVQIVGESLEGVRVTDFDGVIQPSGFSDKIPPFLFRFLRNYISNKPTINSRVCELCMTCVRACPPQVIRRTGGRDRLVIDYDKCIRCYCCLESCPHGAVDIKQGVLAKFSRR
jgi:uncharacterized protein (DUF362 family)/Pyruvate/2-oxoacid:ferredoxin oxidoreductase delta subunit